MPEFVPLWKTPTRDQAIDVLKTCRTAITALVEPLSSAQLQTPTLLGDGSWSVKDMFGHLAEWEIRALETMGVREADGSAEVFASADELNDHHIARKRSWSLETVQDEYEAVHGDLVRAIAETDDQRWYAKIEWRDGRSALGLVLGKILSGARFGYFAHDLAHRADLTKSVDLVSADGAAGTTTA